MPSQYPNHRACPRGHLHDTASRKVVLIILSSWLFLLCGRHSTAQVITPTTTATTTTTTTTPSGSSSSSNISSQPPRESLTVGYITTIRGPTVLASEGLRVSGAMTLAVEHVNEDPRLLPNHTLAFLYADNRDESLRSVEVLTDLWRQDAIAFIGPEDFCATEARVAASWNLPMVSYKCDDPVVSDKARFPTFARTQPPSSQSAKSLLALIKNYGWRRITVLAEDSGLLAKAGENLQEMALVSNITVNDFVVFPPYARIREGNRAALRRLVTDTYLRTRVYMLYTRQEMFIDFVNVLQVLGLTDTAEYVVIGVRDDETYNYTKAADYMFLPGDFNVDKTNATVAAFRSVLLLMSMPTTNPLFQQWEEDVRVRLELPPFNIERTLTEVLLGIQPVITSYAYYLYDAVMIYARALHDVLAEEGDPRDGLAIFNHIRDRTFKSILGHDVYIDMKGDAETNYTVLALREDSNSFGFGLKPVGRFFRDPLDRQILTFLEDVSVYGNIVPLDMPVCGYDGFLCVPAKDWVPHIVGGCIAGIVLIALCIFIGVYRNWRYEQELASLLWKIDPKDIQMQQDAAFSALSMISNNAPHSNASLSFGPDQEQRFTSIGMYKGSLVALKAIHTRHAVDITRTVRLELKQMRDMRFNNVVQFIGATVESHVSNIVMEYCSKGSLEDILENCDLKLDQMFISSIVSDILKGMVFIHSSPILSHGDLKSSNCLVDSRWVVKISDFGLTEFKSKQIVPYHGDHAAYKRLLWTAPEFLKLELKVPLKGTQKGDVYSFGILLYEILCRNGPYGDCHRTPHDIVQRVRNGPVDGIMFRPNTNELSCEGYVTQVMRECWDEDPDVRPDLKTCRKRLRPMQRGMRSNIFDNMMNLMERYANNLETVVAERTVELHDEKKKTEMLLHRMLPPSVAAQLVRGDPVIPEAYESVTIYFSDICGFTSLSSESTPLQVVDMLNDLYTMFDRVIKSYDVYKIETIGDAYMVVSGLPRRNGDNHAGEIASMSLNLLTCIKQFKIRHRPDDVLMLRSGMHTGSCVAGVVGLTMPRYTLFGDTVNTASRMESNGEALKIHVSGESKALLDSLGGYTLGERGLVAMKGKGELRTFWLQDEDAHVRELRTRTSDDSGVHTDLSPAELPLQDSHRRLQKVPVLGQDQMFQTASLIPCIRSSLIFQHHQQGSLSASKSVSTNNEGSLATSSKPQVPTHFQPPPQQQKKKKTKMKRAARNKVSPHKDGTSGFIVVSTKTPRSDAVEMTSINNGNGGGRRASGQRSFTSGEKKKGQPSSAAGGGGGSGIQAGDPAGPEGSWNLPAVETRQPALCPILKNCPKREQFLRSTDAAGERVTSASSRGSGSSINSSSSSSSGSGRGNGSGSGSEGSDQVFSLRKPPPPSLHYRRVVEADVTPTTSEAPASPRRTPRLPSLFHRGKVPDLGASPSVFIDNNLPPSGDKGQQPPGMFFYRNALHPLVRVQAEHSRLNSTDSQNSMADGETSPGRQNPTVTFSDDAIL